MTLLLNVPYSEKDEAKKIGAKWNSNLKKWYVSDKEDYPKFKKWFLNDKSEATIICDYIYIIEGINECFRCGNKTRVIGLGIENYYEFRCYEDNKNKWIYYNGDIHITSHIYPMPNELLKYIQKNYNYKKRFSKTIKREYYANCCEKCDVLQGDFYVFQEVDSPFFIENEDIARNLKLYRMPLKYDIIVDYTEESIGSNDYMIKKYGKMINVELY